jgi:TolB-like protein
MRMSGMLVAMLALVGCVSASPGRAPATALKTVVDELAGGITPRVASARRTSIAIIGFAPVIGPPRPTDAFSDHLVEELTTRLVNDGRVTVAERARLDAVMRELRLQSSGQVSDRSAKQLGQLLGVDAVLVGKYTDFGNEVRLNERIIEAQSGQVLAATSTTVRKTLQVARLLGQEGGEEEAPAAARPIHKRWWFWVIVGAALVGGTAGAVAASAAGDSRVPQGADGRFDPSTFPAK